MNRKVSVIIIVIIVLVVFSGTMVVLLLRKENVHPSVEWIKTFGGADWDHGHSVKQTTDRGYIIICGTESFGAGSSDVYLVKTDSAGNMLWNKTFGGPGFDQGWSVQQTTDGGYVITGNIGSSTYDSNLYLVKTDSAGNMLWNKTFGGSGRDIGWSVQQTNDGGYIITGVTHSFGAVSGDAYLVKTDSAGNMIWNKTFGGLGWDVGESVQQTNDGGYIIAGGTYSFGAVSGDIYLVKTGSAGNMLWNKTFGGSGIDYGYSVQQTVDQGYIITGITWSFGAGLDDVYLVKTDSAGNMIWNKTFGGTNHDYARSVQQTDDGGYIIAGGTESFGSGIYDVYLVKTDSDGVEQRSLTFGGSNNDEGWSVQQTDDGGYIIAGSTQSLEESSDIYLIKLTDFLKS